MANVYNGEAYCTTCDVKVNFTGQVVSINGRDYAKGDCPRCGTAVTRVLGKSA